MDIKINENFKKLLYEYHDSHCSHKGDHNVEIYIGDYEFQKNYFIVECNWILRWFASISEFDGMGNQIDKSTKAKFDEDYFYKDKTQKELVEIIKDKDLIIHQLYEIIKGWNNG